MNPLLYNYACISIFLLGFWSCQSKTTTFQTPYPIKGFPEDLFEAKTINVSNYPPRMYPTSVDGLNISGNAGILDVVLHPQFDKNQLIYVSYVSEKTKPSLLK